MTEEERVKTNKLLQQRSLKLIDINVALPGQVKCHKCGKYEYPELMHVQEKMHKGQISRVRTCWDCKNKK
jgi:hypothetical protein